ncbi:MAG: polysaccharide biosynthesis/export family protein [Acidobacteria bacterium]|nr:polysaccharide biosynthesis/export family protein [Acidobacteriota bacterium]
MLITLCLLLQAAAAPAPSYILGADDELIVRALDLEDIDSKTPFRIDMRGNINLPLAGRMRAAGLTVEQLEAQIIERLKTYVNQPVVTVTVANFRSQPISILGAVTRPGVHQLQGRKTLFEVLSMAEGLRPDAGNSIKITRRKEWGPIPLAGAQPDTTGEFYVAEVSIKSIMEARNPQENIFVQPHDVISVPKGELIYVVGAVRKSGGFILGERETISVLQALSLAEGLDRGNSAKKSRILRPQPGGAARTEIPVDLPKVLAGQTPDVHLQADDILFVPTSAVKSATLRAVEAAIQVGTGVAIYRR